MYGHGLVHRVWGRWVAAGMTSLLLGCAESSAPPAAEPMLTVLGVVTDAAGEALPGVLAEVTLWSSDSATSARAGLAMSDSRGEFEVVVDSVDVARVDSVLLQTTAPGCQTLTESRVIRAQDLPNGPAPVVEVVAAQTSVKPPARSVPGQFCALGIHPFWGPRAYSFAIRIDSTTAEALWGKWQLTYYFSSAADEGSFQGTMTPDRVVLFLTQDIPWNECLTMQVDVPLTPDGQWGEAVVQEPQACLPSPAPFTFAADTIPWLFD